MEYYVRIVFKDNNRTYWKFPRVNKALFINLISNGYDGYIKTKEKFIGVSQKNIKDYI